MHVITGHNLLKLTILELNLTNQKCTLQNNCKFKQTDYSGEKGRTFSFSHLGESTTLPTSG